MKELDIICLERAIGNCLCGLDGDDWIAQYEQWVEDDYEHEEICAWEPYENMSGSQVDQIICDQSDAAKITALQAITLIETEVLKLANNDAQIKRLFAAAREIIGA